MTPSSRLASLDILRGATVAAMIVVNNPGNWSAVYPPLQHSAWNGCTFADLVFPFFIVIMGMALPLTFARRDDRPSPTTSAAIVRRTIWLLVFGLLLNVLTAWPHLDAVRLPGVLQRIAITYCAAAFIAWKVRPPYQIAIALALLVSHWLLLIGESGLGGVAPDHNLALQLDRWLFGSHLLMADGDPEGFLGTLTSVASAVIGIMAGQWILHLHGERRWLPGSLAAAASLLVAAGLVWARIWPLNKPLWSGSYVLFTGGLALWVFSLVYLLAERPRRAWARPFEWLGVNALAIYLGSEAMARLIDRPIASDAGSLLSAKDMIFWRGLVPLVRDGGGARASLIYAVGYVAVWMVVAAVLYRRGVVIRV